MSIQTEKTMWPGRRLLDLLGIDIPIVQAPMAGASGTEMAIAVSEAGGLGSLPCAGLDSGKIVAAIRTFRQHSLKPLNVNFFCHTKENPDPVRDAAWKKRLAKYYEEKGIDVPEFVATAGLSPFDETMCEVVEQHKPEIVSFHFGLPEKQLLNRVKACGSIVFSSATTVEEARWLEANGCDVIIAQGIEAGGHRGMFLTDEITTQVGTLALTPQVVDAVNVPVIAAGGIADGRGIVAAFALGASGVQIGTAYLFAPESLVSDIHRSALHDSTDTALTNLFSGRPARSLVNRLMREEGFSSVEMPPFPTAGAALAPLKARAEASGSADFSSLWAGQSVGLGCAMGARDLTLQLAANATQCLNSLGSTA